MLNNNIFIHINLNLLFLIYLIKSNNFNSFSKAFNPTIYYSFKFNNNLKNDKPKEKISHFSASNNPISSPLFNLINSGDI